MMRRRRIQFATSAVAGAMTILATGPVSAQQASTSAGSASRPRSTDERVNTELATPPPVNSDYRRAAEGTLPVVPGAAPVPVAGGAIDPAARPLAGANGLATTNPARPALPPGADAAMLIVHAVAMGVEGSTLAAVAEANKPDENGNDAVKALMTHAMDETRESKELMTRAAAAGNSLDANSPVRRLYGAANGYLTTLGSLTAPGGAGSPNDKAQIAAINHAVKAVMDSDHLMQLGAMAPASPALDALMGHARMMREEGSKTLERIAGTAPLDPSAPMTPIALAARGRELLAAGDALGPIARPLLPGVAGPGINGQNGALPVPGRLQDTRPEIIGGTFGTGSPTAGTATGAEAARNVRDSTEGPGGVLNVPVPSSAPGSGQSGYGVGNNNTPPTNSNAGSRPR